MWCMLPDDEGTKQQGSLFSFIPTAITQEVFYLQEHGTLNVMPFMNEQKRKIV